MSRVRAVLELAAAVVLGVVAVLAWLRGVRTSDFPTAAGPTPVAGTFYSGPWVLLALVAGGAAALLLLRVVAGAVAGVSARPRPSARPHSAELGHWEA
ncbi:hypothetical protein GCM10027047_29220 [Rhodococcus aerolatus]